MKSLYHVILFEWKALWRSNTIKVLLTVVFFFGIYGIYFGKFETDKQKVRIAQVKDYERQQFDSLMFWAAMDTTIATNKEKYLKAVSPTGVGWNKHFTYYLAHEIPAAAGLCLGQRDLFPVYYGFNVTDLARQVNTGELANPMKLLTGNFDLSYVFVFLFPLLVVALFYDLFAQEKEGGTLSLLKSQSSSLWLIFVGRGLMRLLIVWGLVTVLLLLGFLLQGIPIFENGQLFGEWLMLIFGYCLLWVGVMALVVWLRRGSALSAMMGLGLWLVFTLVTPALINLVVLANKPLPNRADLIHAVRKLNDQNWENPKSFVLNKFYPTYPQFNDGDTIDFNKWYYASFTLLDQEADQLNSHYENRINQRNAVLKQWEWMAPAAVVHERLSKFSHTDRESHQLFLEEVRQYHQELKELYYARIFARKQFSIADLQKLEKQL